MYRHLIIRLDQSIFILYTHIIIRGDLLFSNLTTKTTTVDYLGLRFRRDLFT